MANWLKFNGKLRQIVGKWMNSIDEWFFNFIVQKAYSTHGNWIDNVLRKHSIRGKQQQQSNIQSYIFKVKGLKILCVLITTVKV